MPPSSRAFYIKDLTAVFIQSVISKMRVERALLKYSASVVVLISLVWCYAAIFVWSKI